MLNEDLVHIYIYSRKSLGDYLSVTSLSRMRKTALFSHISDTLTFLCDTSLESFTFFTLHTTCQIDLD